MTEAAPVLQPPRFVHCAGDVVEQGPHPRVIPLATARTRADHWRLAAGAHLLLDQPRLSALYARDAAELTSVLDAAERWRRCFDQAS
jgi:hypothetical protein